MVTVRPPAAVVTMLAAPSVMAEVLAVPIWTTPLVVVPVPPWRTKLPPTEVVPVWLEPRRVKLEPVKELPVESPGASTKALEVAAAAVVISLVWLPARVRTPAVERSKLVPSMATVAELLPSPVTPVEVSVVKAPEAAVVAPIWVALIPVAVVLKVEAPVPEVMVRALLPVLIELALRPDRARAPEVAVRLRAPVVRVRPLLAVSRPAEVMVPEPVAEMLPLVEIVPSSVMVS